MPSRIIYNLRGPMTPEEIADRYARLAQKLVSARGVTVLPDIEMYVSMPLDPPPAAGKPPAGDA